MIEYFKKLFADNPKIRKIVGVILITIGLASVLTPFTPVGFLLIVGLEMIGLRLVLQDKIKSWFKK